MSSRHAWLGPSSSDIWLTCLGAPHEWSTRPPRRVGYAAREGTLAHTLCEALATVKPDAEWTPGQKFDVEGTEVELTQEMLAGVKVFTDTTRILSEFALWRMIEHEVSLAWLWEGSKAPTEIFGTLDFASCDGLVLYIEDFKYGKGKSVKAEHNTQLLCYALGALGALRRDRPDLYATLKSVCLVIVQPRAGGSPVRQWTIPVGDLVYWGFSTLKPTVEAIINAKGKSLPLTPGRHCYFCAASIDCEAYLKQRRDEDVKLFPDYDPAKEDLSFEELV